MVDSHIRLPAIRLRRSRWQAGVIGIIRIIRMLTTHEQLVQQLFSRACQVLAVKNLTFHPMNGRVGPVNTKKSFSLGHTSLKRGVVTIDIYTPRHRKPKSYNSILRVIAHEIAHHQKPPFRQQYKGHLIARRHYPEFYRQVNRNVERFKRDEVLGKFFNT